MLKSDMQGLWDATWKRDIGHASLRQPLGGEKSRVYGRYTLDYWDRPVFVGPDGLSTAEIPTALHREFIH
jgi:hypothetical protein